MRKDFGAKPLLVPQPVCIIATYDENGVPNAMNAAWAGIAEENQIIICLGPHKTTDNLERCPDFTVSVGTKEQVVACDFVGIVSGHKVPDKVARAGFTTTKAPHVNAPIINELPLTLECKLLKILEDELYLAEIVNVSVEENVLDEAGKLSYDKFHPIIFDAFGHNYYAIGEKAGNAFSDGVKLK
ncbi:MAG: flavin reductase family protein [Phascolarctobacterium sp.]|nr:flavin reductase family protein [Phascolarctobacterium sp.]